MRAWTASHATARELDTAGPLAPVHHRFRRAPSTIDPGGNLAAQRGGAPDFRFPNATAPLPVGYDDVWATVPTLEGLTETGEWVRMKDGPNFVA